MPRSTRSSSGPSGQAIASGVDSREIHMKSSDDEEEGCTAGSAGSANTSISQQECSICLSQLELPIQLPCSHYFCYTCAKGLAQTNKSCAMCRQPIPPDFLKDPDKYVIGVIVDLKQEFAWFYEGNKGWWLYEPRVQNEVEMAYVNGEKSMEALIAGHLYVLDLEYLLQYRKDYPSKRRRIKRAFTNSEHKGLAGLRQERRPEFPPGQES